MATQRERPAGRDAWAIDGFAPVPGDLVALPGGERATVETVYLCAESSIEGGLDLVTRWSWIVLSDGHLLEVAPRGCALYDRPQVLTRGSGPFLALVAQDGALVRFEERVRAGTWEARPVRLTFEGRRWRATSTGTVTAHRLGLTSAGGWGQLGTTPHPPTPSPARGRGGAASKVREVNQAGSTEATDVYFTLAALDDSDALGLGVWATDIYLAFGRRLGESPKAAGLGLVVEEG